MTSALVIAEQEEAPGAAERVEPSGLGGREFLQPDLGEAAEPAGGADVIAHRAVRPVPPDSCRRRPTPWPPRRLTLLFRVGDRGRSAGRGGPWSELDVDDGGIRVAGEPGDRRTGGARRRPATRGARGREWRGGRRAPRPRRPSRRRRAPRRGRSRRGEAGRPGRAARRRPARRRRRRGRRCCARSPATVTLAVGGRRRRRRRAAKVVYERPNPNGNAGAAPVRARCHQPCQRS